jgi:hypothetical protein
LKSGLAVLRSIAHDLSHDLIEKVVYVAIPVGSDIQRILNGLVASWVIIRTENAGPDDIAKQRIVAEELDGGNVCGGRVPLGILTAFASVEKKLARFLARAGPKLKVRLETPKCLEQIIQD